MLNEYKNELSDADLEMVSGGLAKRPGPGPTGSMSGGGGEPGDGVINIPVIQNPYWWRTIIVTIV